MPTNMDLWNAVCKPPESALKKITGGRLNGMTDIKPQWRYQVMTEQFGPCGKDWSYEIVKLWTEPGTEGQVLAFAQVMLKVKGMDVPGIGGSMLVSKERNGMHCNDEAYKMAVTDALSTAMKMLGVAADVYMGKWDGSKYKDETPQAPAAQPAPAPQAPAPQQEAPPTPPPPTAQSGPEVGSEPLPGVEILHGIVEQISKRTGEFNGKPWTRYGIKVKNQWYNTFSESDAAIAQGAKDKGININFQFKVNDKGYKDLVYIDDLPF